VTSTYLDGRQIDAVPVLGDDIDLLCCSRRRRRVLQRIHAATRVVGISATDQLLLSQSLSLAACCIETSSVAARPPSARATDRQVRAD